MMHILGHGDRRRYNPARDLAYSWPSMAQAAFSGLEHDLLHPTVAHYLRHHRVSQEDLLKAAETYAHFFELATNPDGPATVDDALQAAGFLDLPFPAQGAVFMALGCALTPGFFESIRDVTVLGETQPLSDRTLRDRTRAALARLAARGFVSHYVRKVTLVLSAVWRGLTMLWLRPRSTS